ncbi:MAG: hypothetical protein EAZ51_08495 [Sphingobacteriales bacterium]|nr:MAG: hypothetical protein EAZ64_04355 [Sphingobacteriales bacterium]TAF78972.1 MAG: hypothetical protein EAZ51_08495 [Sphingobacteriales bacterium]
MVSFYYIHNKIIKVQIDLAKYSSTQFSNFLSDISSISEQDIESLDDLATQFPYCQALHTLVAKASIGTQKYEDKLAKSAIYATSREVLYEMIASGSGLSGNEPRALGIEPLAQPEEIKPENPLLTTEQEARSPQPVAPTPQIETYDHHDSVLIKEVEEDAISAISYQQFKITPTAQGQHTETPKLESPVQQSPEPVTLYNDDTLPFTFLWWLNKTRKEHYENNQPYCSLPEAPSPQLNHQITESILQQGTINSYIKSTLSSEPVTKEDYIIEKFISNDPQIKPLPANKIDTENKAKASSADSGELVSETLAKIYVEQMLYAKALDTYQKLSLKYPEKSTYFASHIKYLELKVN